MKLLNRIKSLFQRNQTSPTAATSTSSLDAGMVARLARLERNYLVLLKQVLKIDGVELKFSTGKNSPFSEEILSTKTNKGLNERKPTIH